MRPADERDFRQFAAAASPDLLRLAGALTGSQSAAQQLVTRVLAGLARDWQRIDGDRDRLALRRIVREYAGRGELAGRTDLDPVVPSARPESADSWLWHAVLGRLDRRSRALLALRYLRDCGDDEAAGLLGGRGGGTGGGAGGRDRPAGTEVAQALERVRSLCAAVSEPATAPGPTEVAVRVRDTLQELAAATRPADLADAALGSVGRRWRLDRLAALAGVTRQ